MGYRGARSRIPWSVSRASDVLEMIQQKSMHRKCETGGLTAFSKSRRRSEVLEENPKEKTNVRSRVSDVTRLATAQQCKRQRQLDQLLHSGAGDLTAHNKIHYIRRTSDVANATESTRTE